MLQLTLFDWINPFREKIKNGVLQSVPSSSGIYRFYDHNGSLLYVGKSKNVKKRIQSYGRIHPQKDSKRLVRLAYKIDSIQVELCETEEQALLLENKWLRNEKPEFNRANTKPELYAFAGIKQKENKIFIGWTLSEDNHPFDRLFGAYKGLSSFYGMLRSLQAIGSLITKNQTFSPLLLRKTPPLLFTWPFYANHTQFGLPFLQDILTGTSIPVSDLYQESESLQGFEKRVFDESFDCLYNWFVSKAILRKKMIESNNIKNDLIPQHGWDDWLVKLKK